MSVFARKKPQAHDPQCWSEYPHEGPCSPWAVPLRPLVIALAICLAVLLAIWSAGCASRRSAPATPHLLRLEVQVASDAHQAIGAADVRILDGPNAHRTARTGPDGRVFLDALRPASQTICATHEQHVETCQPLPIDQLRAGNVTIVLPRKAPPLPQGDPLAVRTDFLTLHCDGRIHYTGPFPAYDAGKRARILDCLRSQGYTDIWLDVLLGRQGGGWLDVQPYDYLDRPHALRPFLEEIRDAGLRTIVVIGLEDNPPARAKYPPGKLARVVEQFVRGVDDLASIYLLGVEVREWASWSEVLDLIEAVGKASSRPIAVHQNQRKWGPDRGDPWTKPQAQEMAWWTEAKRRAPKNRLALAFQGSHARVEDSGGGFLSPREEFIRDIRGFLDLKRLAGIGVEVIASEYGHLVSDAKTKALGRAALQAGAIGCTNGC